MKDATTQPEKRRAIFLDRDGTLNEEVGYLRSLADLRFCAGALEAVRLINEAGWLAIVLTNQSGVARGLFPETFIGEVHAEMQLRLQLGGAHLDAVYACPHLPPEEGQRDSETARQRDGKTLRQYRIECDCRKPKPGLIRRAVADFGIDVMRSFVIGDRYRDVEMGHNAGTQSGLVLTGYGREEYAQRAHWPRQPEFVAATVLEAVQTILKWDALALNPQAAIEPCVF